LYAAGFVIDPPVDSPIEITGLSIAATIAPAPPEEPPTTLSGS